MVTEDIYKFSASLDELIGIDASIFISIKRNKA